MYQPVRRREVSGRRTQAIKTSALIHTSAGSLFQLKLVLDVRPRLPQVAEPPPPVAVRVQLAAPGDLRGPHRQGETRRTVDLGHSSDGPSWIDLAEIRVNVTESRFVACLNRLLQQNRSKADIDGRPRHVCSTSESGHSINPSLRARSGKAPAPLISFV